jgi:hypothetical protein
MSRARSSAAAANVIIMLYYVNIIKRRTKVSEVWLERRLKEEEKELAENYN